MNWKNFKFIVLMGEKVMFKIGIVGAGIIGKSHSTAINNNPDCCLVAVCDTIEERASELAKEHNAKVFTDYKKMHEETKLDAVILNLPHFLHHDVAVWFLEHGVNVLVEKPMAMSVSECEAMIEAAKKSGAKLAIGHVQRYYQAYNEVKKLIENGKYGKLCMITEVRNINYLPNRPKWFLDKNLSGGGIVMNYGAHTLDKIMYVTGEKVSEAKAILSNPLSQDNIEINAQILLKMTDGVSAAITYCGCPGVDVYETLFYFEQGVAKIVNGHELMISENGQFIDLCSGGNLFTEQLAEFLKYVKGEESIVVTPEYGKEIIRVLEEILENE